MNLSRLFALVLAGFAATQPLAFAAGQEDINVIKDAKVRLIPISIAGYTGEVDKVLRFDLDIAGFRIVPAEEAQYNLVGKHDGAQVEGRVTDRLSKATILGKVYSGGTPRSQAHSLSDEIVGLILRTPGVARTKIAFKGENGVGKSEIYISDYDGFGAKAVTEDNNIVAAPAWMPGYWHLFYTSYRSGYADIYSHNLTTGDRRPFAKFPGLNSSAAISQDGKRVAMILSKSGSPDVWVMNIDGTGLLQLTKTPEDESSPCWSPDGRTICFASRVNERRALYLVPSSGGAMRRLSTEGYGNPSEPDWSPDGKQILFTSQARGFTVCVTTSEGGAVEALTEGEDASWAPNSRTAIFTRRSGNKRVLSLLDVPSKRVKDIAQVSGSRSQPSWAK
jgi:TolB protein